MINRRLGVTSLVAMSIAACGGGEPEVLDPVPTVVIQNNNGGWSRGTVSVRATIAPFDIVSTVTLNIDGVPSTTIEDPTAEPGGEPGELFIRWDTTQVADGEHQLVVVATTATGRSASDDSTAQVDNTAPVITLVSQSSTETPLDLQFAVQENGSGVFAASLRSRIGFASYPIDAATWRASITGCVNDQLEAEVVDRAGNVGTTNVDLNAIDSCDRDCDGARATGACGGNDCNDASRYIPSPTDNFGDLVDDNCDGVDGIDADGDGVPGSSSGSAPDCNDTLASVHGYWSGWSAINSLGLPRRDGNESLIAMHGNAAAVLYPVMVGGPTNTALDLARRNAAGVWSPSTRLADAVIGSRAAVQFDSAGTLHAAFSRSTANGSIVVYATDATGSMVSETVANGIFEGMTIDDAGIVHLIYDDSSTSTPRHAHTSATGWQFVTLTQPSSNARGAVFTQGGVVTYVHSDSSGIRIDRFIGGSWTVERVTASASYLADAIPFGADIVLAAVDSMNRVHVFGGALGAWPGTSFAPSGFGTSRLSAGADGRLHLVLDPESGFLGLHRVYSGGVWYQEPAPAMGRIATDAAGRAYGIGTVFPIPMPMAAGLLGEGTPQLPAADTVGDGVDQDCDGVDG